MARATALKEGLRVAREAMWDKASANAEPQSLQLEPGPEAERARASWAAVHSFEGLLEFAAEVRKVRAMPLAAAVVDCTGALGRFDAFTTAQYQEVLRAAEAESRHCNAKAETLKSARAAWLHLLAEHTEEEEARANPPRDVHAKLVAAKKAAKRAMTQVRLVQVQLEQGQLEDDDDDETKECRERLVAAKEAGREVERQCAAEHATLYSRIGSFPELLREMRLVRSGLETLPLVGTFRMPPWHGASSFIHCTATLTEQQANRLLLDLVSLFHDGRTLDHYEARRLIANSNRPVYKAALNGRKVALKEYAVRADELKVSLFVYSLAPTTRAQGAVCGLRSQKGQGSW